MISKFGVGSALALAALALAACSQEQTAPAPAAPRAATFEIVAYGGAAVQNSDGTITASRQGEGSQGVTLTPASDAPVLVTFVAEGDDLRVRVRQDGDWRTMRSRPEHAYMLGGEGASHIRIFSHTAPSITTRVVSVQNCSDTGVRCRPLPARPDDAAAK